MIDSNLIAWIPLLLLAIGFMLVMPSALLAAHRTTASITGLAILLGSILVHIIGDSTPTPAGIFMHMLAAVLIALPLLERARMPGMLIASLVGAYMLLFAIPTWLVPELPGITTPAMMLVIIAASALVGIIGGLTMPLNPRRREADGRIVWHAAPQAPMLMGWAALTIAIMCIVGFGMFTKGHATAMIVAALVALLHSTHRHGEDGLQKAGEAMLAGLLITLLVPLTPIHALFLGLIAGYLVVRSEAMAHTMQIDDPHHVLGAMLLPSILGLLLPGLVGIPLLADAIEWIGATFGIALLISLILWPFTMLLLGIALPAKLVRNGRASA